MDGGPNGVILKDIQMSLNIIHTKNSKTKTSKNQVLSKKLTAAEAAKIKKVSARTIYNWIKKNKIDADTTGNCIYVIENDKFHNAQSRKKSKYKQLRESYQHDLQQLYTEIESLSAQLQQKQDVILNLEQENHELKQQLQQDNQVVEATFEVNNSQQKLLPMLKPQKPCTAEQDHFFV